MGTEEISKIAQRAYDNTHENAPVDVPNWNRLEQVERTYLTRFAKEVIRLNDAAKVNRKIEALLPY